ncbi:SusC/RagA family TonB-linked outer membrane protein [Hymenobacter sp. GOD-10R]|uniref:SusC/RagA family TonB-linked outer membrane protein n=1 Tax=Hymenobacter sp. GOD-10R TaxID=3093922 RepID=UPI002D781F8C|nr:SusC/RagA family TonB-linked outer membrane protein [Hymenobacter sp. GOD-10R]WRQ30512.1 SusC/RagA family TonB-linked outer membrane protein [Hymenobacter sp. GOD-10R]
MAHATPKLNDAKHTTGQEAKKTLIFHSLAKTFYPTAKTFNQASIPVKGRVVDELGKPIPGATILVKGTSNAAAADANGNYTLDVPDGASTLVVSSIGFTPQEVAISSRTTIDITLKTDVKSLNEVVVVGYGTQRRAEVTSAVSTVKAEDFNQGGTRNALDLIQGKVAGLSVTRTQGNNPNSSPAIQLRGIVSVNGSLAPLIVIDGIPGGNLDLLQQDDIESFDVLKDGSAAAIYGTRGNAGVILITTKKGKAGPARFDYSTYVQHEAVAKRPRFLNAEEWRAYSADPNNPKASQMRDLGASTDFYNLLINKDNLSQYHNLAMSGGSNTGSYRASMYYNDADPIAIQNWRKQYGGRLSLNQRGFNDMLSAQINLATNFNQANLLGGRGGDFRAVSSPNNESSDFENALGRNPTQPVFNPDGTYYEEGSTTNPIGRLNQEKNRRDQNTTSADVRFTLEPIEGLRATAFGALIRDAQNDNEYRQAGSRFSQIGTLNGTPVKGTAYARKRNYLENNYTFESTLEYNRTIHEDHTLRALGGYSYQYRVFEEFSGSNSGFLNDVFQENNLGAGNFLQLGKSSLGSNKEDNRLIAFFGRVNYSYKDKYIAQFILRHEGSSRFGANHKYGDFPAASIGWTISKENFMSGLTVINDLKLRAGYGITGNQGIPNYQSVVRLGTGNQYLNDDGIWRQTYGPNNNPNPDLRWERKKEFNVGVDFALFNSRLTGTVDVYRRRTSDLLGNFNTQLPPFVQSSLYTNVGVIDNNGVELTLSGTVLKKKNFSWGMDFTGSTQSNKLVSFSDDVFRVTFLTFGDIGGFGALGPSIRTIEGGPLGSFYGKRFAGFTPEGRWLFNKANGEAVTADKIVPNDDYAYIGNGIPKYYMSWNNRFQYKNLDLTLFFRGKFKYDILNLQQVFFGNKVYLPNNVLKDAITRNNQINDALQFSDYYLEPGGFVKLDNVTLGYNFKFKTPLVRNLRLYLTGRNLLTFTKYRGVDPEVDDTGLAPGIDGRGFYPRTRSFTAGLNIGF